MSANRILTSLILISAACVSVYFLIAAMRQIDVDFQVKPIASPAYSTGDCVKYTSEEDWHESRIYRVERVGKRNYLLRQYPWNHWKPVDGITAPFGVAEDVLEKIECPTITG